jgi:pyroglutamyl-peptidase
MIALLVTGFGPFPGAPKNPSAKIIEALDARRLARLGIKLEKALLPVVFSCADERLAALIAHHGPDGILHLGLAAQRRTLSVELRACNRHSVFHRDANGKLPKARTIVAGAEQLRQVRLPAARIRHALTRRGAKAQPSIDAGRYACNQVLYLTLGTKIRAAGFIHVPRPHPSLSLAAMIAGVETALIEMAKDLRSQ